MTKPAGLFNVMNMIEKPLLVIVSKYVIRLGAVLRLQVAHMHHIPTIVRDVLLSMISTWQKLIMIAVHVVRGKQGDVLTSPS